MLALESLRETILSNAPTKDVIGVFFALNLCAYLIVYVSKRWTELSGKTARASSPDVEKPASGIRGKVTRPPGEWTPSDFKRPTAAPYPDWNVHTTKPIPYRPFRYGPKYFITMGLRSMKWDEWIELDNHYLKYHADKARRIEERGSKCCHTDPEAMDGAIELLEELCAYLPERYPTMFQKTATGITNTITNETFNITQRPLPEDPMATAARLVQDDLALMIERPDGEYYLLGGAILLAGFWRLTDKFGMRLSEIHTSGSVPGYESKLEKGMMNFFRRLKPEDPVIRNNYFIQVDDNLAWSYSIGSEDAETVSWNTAEKNRAVECHYFRSERQSLRRLPKSGAVVFTIRTYFEPVTEVVKEPFVPGRLADAVRSWGDDVSRYKGREKYQEVLLEFLDRKHSEQVEGGLEVEKEDEMRSYPF
ncbi:hypothetical protein N7499_002632 [Penicillium canescens]|uniref:Uncharacterized protein n=1 Tax=Penicillium canescens TaxID=5083 RepID=A0AAD6N6L7_PENCN|nr:hypothetical protein N7460_009656 [Penicillium canescens]KAJ6037604.1 hypothetical protein N7444_010309 [Penicillium canescens]KAJ6098258.1 hypothetical protein N7499_002632 [Penicillium canescens]KAJ6166247.1 hypothetical protein N7485_009491 [Penicillium canescens]